jgi:hypothetical protein
MGAGLMKTFAEISRVMECGGKAKSRHRFLPMRCALDELPLAEPWPTRRRHCVLPARCKTSLQ